MIELANFTDHKDILAVIEQSILSCVADHQNDPKTIEAWLSNKTPDQLEIWLQQHIGYSYKVDNRVQGFILFSASGYIFLNYVSPKHQGHGIGSALLKTTIKHLNTLQVSMLRVESTLTAASFYEKSGFVCTETIYENQQPCAYAMEKDLVRT
ncbi:GNAT family N-acetyltransferase [Acinetobacter rathckeae]|uniref:GNAT family N-acetyltransferase n=1 Tax=Acinetobacter rathckeae TaxID=2605272 RepID=UPI0018A2C3CA|nr:GNAT family N-acetyltransferase [Acinetobacter rathckeae]MBF7688089.1 GNAT family N-acetyltransferase [Acinetobacter rathckeae]MBF7695399.1 GNAT family N-acetyltransferase [Acinetobacter rathckeae]